MIKSGKNSISGSTLKLIAMAAMLADHAAVVFLEDAAVSALADAALFRGLSLLVTGKLFSFGAPATLYIVGRLVGRLAFPIFAFLITEGFRHTRNVKKYALRLAVFAAVSEIPFNLIAAGEPFSLEYQNIFFTLLLGLAATAVVSGEGKEPLRIAASALIALSASFLNTDYGAYGVFIIVLFYLTSSRRVLRNCLCGCALLIQLTAPLSLLPINAYNGKRGLNLKYVFYVFYPAHLLMLYFINELIIR
ncbi:MAG: hypothetical protein GX051_07915 [Clostridiales bacterium]|nr:hypothetical protein [Clostridiales bacterium]